MIDADHGQFYVQDLDPYDAWIAEHATDPDLPPAGWTKEAVHVHRIGVEPHSISVGTARDDMVESLITVHTSAPTTDPTAEHIVETDLDVKFAIGGSWGAWSSAVGQEPVQQSPQSLLVRVLRRQWCPAGRDPGHPRV
ncbi:hypothetical protein [Streptomyces sp. NPDC046727]|uniref:hypothetical protein n=1 Tax=Streptomyces sp. NPDC046727 TaxID=3155373 RepID=UPI0033DFE42C